MRGHFNREDRMLFLRMLDVCKDTFLTRTVQTAAQVEIMASRAHLKTCLLWRGQFGLKDIVFARLW